MRAPVSRRCRSTLVALVVVALFTGTGAASAATGADTVDLVVVRYRNDVAPDLAAATERAAGAQLVKSIHPLDTRIVAVSGGRARQAVEALERSPLVAYAEVDGTAVADAIPNDPYWSQQWGPAKVNSPAAWDHTTGSSNVVVAVLDTGVDAAQPDLKGAVLPGRDIVNGDDDAADDHGHGTKTAGVIAARTNNSTGVAGMCWTCSVLPVKVLASDGSAQMSDVAAGIVWAADNGADIVNMSLSGSTDQQVVRDAVAYATARDVLLVASAGNMGSTEPRYPAANAGVVSVAASDASDGRYGWSTHGTWVDVAAPGCNYTTTARRGYGEFCGTSSAAPVVAGAAALALAAAPSATAAGLEQGLVSTAVPVPFVNHGRIDAAEAVAFVSTANAGITEPASAATTLTFSGELTRRQPCHTHSFTSGAGDLAASLSFTRAASLTMTLKNSAGAALASVEGPSVLHMRRVVDAGGYTISVCDEPRAQYTLTITLP